MNPRSHALLALASACGLSLLAGCTTSFAPVLDSENPTQAAVGALQGNVHGGQQGVSGAHVYVMQAATTGYGAASTSLITAAKASGTDTVGSYVTTDKFGSFGVTGDYTCTSGSQVYLLAEQGNPGAASGTNNTAIGLMAALGACPASGTLAATVPYVTINEVSTVVAAYALAGFAVNATHIGSSGTALAVVGLNNAAAMVPNMMSVASGTALTATAATGSTGVVPMTEINTLANILASCINTTGPTQGGCPTLFADATSTGASTGTKPTETATAAINIAHHPAEAPTALYGLQSSTPPFAPNLSAAPNDFTLKIYYTGGGLSGAAMSVAVDGSGNIWVPSGSNNALSKFSPLGVPLSGSSGFTGGGLSSPIGVAIDTSGNAWVANLAGRDVSKFNSSGVSQAGTTGYVGNNDLNPYQIAIDTAGYVWVTNLVNPTVSKISSTGTEVLNTTNGGSFGAPQGIAIDASNNVWVTDADSTIDVLNNSTGTDSLQGGASGGEITCSSNCYLLQLSSGTSPTAWFTTTTSSLGDGLHNFSASTVGTSVTYTGGGLQYSEADSLDGAGNIWVADGNSAVVEFNSSGAAVTPSTGYTSALSSAYGIAVDGSGNVWVSDDGNTAKKLMEIVGAATPTVTPLVQAVINNNIAGRP